MKKVRYMTVSRIAIELVSKQSTEEKSEFVDFLNSAFKQIEKGEPVSIPEGNGVMSIAIEETITELITGYKNYCQKMTAVEKALEKKRLKELKEMGIEPSDIGDTSPTDTQRPISDTSPTDIISIGTNDTLPDKGDDSGGDTGNPVEKSFLPEDKNEFNVYWFQIASWLNTLGIPFVNNDPDILTAWKDNGVNAIAKVFYRLDERKEKVTKEAFISMVYEEGKHL